MYFIVEQLTKIINTRDIAQGHANDQLENETNELELTVRQSDFDV